VAEVREPLEGTFSLNLSAIPEFDRAIARFSRRYPMKINADLSQRAVVYSEDLPWVDSPLPGVQRRMLERDGEEVARATSVVRYAPDSSFDPHTHGGGEEFLVLEGVFSDEHGDFGPGVYVRNPPGSRHTPRSAPGCTILVKLRQMDRDDQEQVRIDTRRAPWQPGPVEGASVMPLFERGSEMVALWRLAPGTRLQRHVHAGGEETFVLEGTLEDELGRYPKRAWLRNPPGSWHQPFSQDGCLLYVKTGHLGG
jgi:anti-sigma factor ChrR (cupin superfamily)